MRLRSTIALIALFFAGLAALWWAEYAAIPTAAEKRERLDLVLPGLADLAPDDVRSVQVDYPGEGNTLVVERDATGGWQLREPVDTAADPNLVDTLVRNLKEMRKSTAAGTIEGDPAAYELDKPAAVITLLGRSGAEPVAVLAVGKTAGAFTYARPDQGPGIEVVDAPLLSALRLPTADWRDKSLFRMPSFSVAGLTVEEAEPARVAELKRDDRHWKMVRPFATPADDDKAEGLAAELAALHVAGADGFVADGVKDLAPYGLDRPSMTLVMTPFGNGLPQTVRLGKPVPNAADEVYALRGGQDDVVKVNVKMLRELYRGPNSVRSQRLTDLVPARALRLRYEAKGLAFDLVRTNAGWEVLKPRKEKADGPTVQALLAAVAGLQTSEFLDPSSIAEPRTDPPQVRIQIWDRAAVSGNPESEPTAPPTLNLRLGRHDVLRKTVYAQLEGDANLLAVPDLILKSLPVNPLAFRDRALVSVDAARVRRLTIDRDGKSVTVEAPGSGTAGLSWRMVAPVSAPADERAVTNAIVALTNLRAQSWESDTVGDGSRYGLDHPWLRVTWSLERPDQDGSAGESQSLRVGKAKPGAPEVYANLEGTPEVFTLTAPAVTLFEAEMHDPTVLKLRPSDVRRLVFRWPDRTIALESPLDAAGAAGAWTPVPGYDPGGFDLTRVNRLVGALADLKTPRFVQYAGPIRPVAGLDPPLVSVEVWGSPPAAPRTLRVGALVGDSGFFATTATGAEGPVFLLPAVEVWKDLIPPPRRFGDLPDDPFAPAG